MPPKPIRSAALPLTALLAVLLAGACGEKLTPEEAAARGCRAHYDILQRWITGHGEMPEDEEELKRAAQLGEPDPWGTPYDIEILEGRPHVWSAGPDRKWQTGDEIVYPPLEPEVD